MPLLARPLEGTGLIAAGVRPCKRGRMCRLCGVSTLDAGLDRRPLATALELAVSMHLSYAIESRAVSQSNCLRGAV